MCTHCARKNKIKSIVPASKALNLLRDRHINGNADNNVGHEMIEKYTGIKR